MKIVCFSDVHIGGKFNEEMFMKGVSKINSINADYYIFSGDLTDQATLAEFELAKNRYLPLIEKPVLLIPGNHDVKNSGFLLWEEFIGDRFFVHTDEEKKVKILGLDSNEPDRNTGRIDEKGIDRIYDEFHQLDDTWAKILVFHHQTLPIKYTGRERSAIYDAGDVIKAITDCNIDVVINGHRHISNVYTITDGDFKSVIVNVGTMSCKKTRYREEYSITTIDFDIEKNTVGVDLLLLNRDEDIWIKKFEGHLQDPVIDQNELGTPIATIIQIGNTEFSDEVFDAESFINGVNLINSIHNVDLVVHNGDVTNNSYVSEFKRAQSMLSLIKHPMITVPGPKDYYPLGVELWSDYFGHKDKIIENDKFILHGLNSCIPDDRAGRIGRSRSHLFSNLGNHEKIGIVAWHHNIIPIPSSKHESELQDAGDILAAIVENNVELILTGAKNRAACWQVDNTVFINAGTLSSKNINTKKGNSINKIEIYETDIGKFYKIDEIFTNNGEIVPLGRLHIETVD